MPPTKKPKLPQNPIQPLVVVNDVLRFKANKIVQHLLECCENRIHADMNSIAVGAFSRDDRAQFAQLIGYSWSGAGDLSYMPSRILETSWDVHERGVTPEAAHIERLEMQLAELKEALREPIANLYEIHPSDLGGDGDE